MLRNSNASWIVLWCLAWCWRPLLSDGLAFDHKSNSDLKIDLPSPTLGNFSSIRLHVCQPLVRLEHVSLTFPMTLQRRLFSSIPYRELALDDINVAFNPGTINLLTGPSSSGKSCVLGIMGGDIAPTKGEVVTVISGLSEADTPTSLQQAAPYPIYLDQRKVTFPGKTSVHELAARHCQTLLANVPILSAEDDSVVLDRLIELLGESLLSWNLSEMKKTTVEQLSTSEYYLTQVMIASLSSMLSQPSATSEGGDTHRSTYTFVAPVILLDEWLDLETSVVIHGVQQGLATLCESLGALVCSATHRSERYQKPVQRYKMRNGKLC